MTFSYKVELVLTFLSKLIIFMFIKFEIKQIEQKMELIKKLGVKY